jgi:hypothetical protein
MSFARGQLVPEIVASEADNFLTVALHHLLETRVVSDRQVHDWRSASLQLARIQVGYWLRSKR